MAVTHNNIYYERPLFAQYINLLGCHTIMKYSSIRILVQLVLVYKLIIADHEHGESRFVASISPF